MEKINKVLDLVERSRVLREVRDDLVNEIAISHSNKDYVSLLKKDITNCDILLENINLEISRLTSEIDKECSAKYSVYDIEGFSSDELPF